VAFDAPRRANAGRVETALLVAPIVTDEAYAAA